MTNHNPRGHPPDQEEKRGQRPGWDNSWATELARRAARANPKIPPVTLLLTHRDYHRGTGTTLVLFNPRKRSTQDAHRLAQKAIRDLERLEHQIPPQAPRRTLSLATGELHSREVAQEALRAAIPAVCIILAAEFIWGPPLSTPGLTAGLATLAATVAWTANRIREWRNHARTCLENLMASLDAMNGPETAHPGPGATTLQGAGQEPSIMVLTDSLEPAETPRQETPERQPELVP